MIHASPSWTHFRVVSLFNGLSPPWVLIFHHCCHLGILLKVSAKLGVSQRYKFRPFLQDFVTHVFGIYTCMFLFYLLCAVVTLYACSQANKDNFSRITPECCRPPGLWYLPSSTTAHRHRYNSCTWFKKRMTVFCAAFPFSCLWCEATAPYFGTFWFFWGTSS